MIFLIAPLLNLFYDFPDLAIITRILSLTILMKGFMNIYITLLRKELKFKKLFIFNFGGTLTTFIVSVTLALILKNYWAYVIGVLSGNIFYLIISYILPRKLPKFEFHKEEYSGLLNFGKWIFLSTILIFLLNDGNAFYVSLILGGISLSYYQMAYRISNIPTMNFTGIISIVTLPVYSKLQDKPKLLKNYFLQIFKISVFTIISISLLIFFLGDDFVSIILGEKWKPIIPSMRILALCGMIVAIINIFSPIFLAFNEPKTLTKYQFFQTVFLYLLIVPFTKIWEIEGTSLALLIAASLMIYFRFKKGCKLINCHFKEIIPSLLCPVLLSILAFIPTIIFKSLAKDLFFNIWFLILEGSIFMIFFFVGILFFEKFSKYQIIKTIQWFFIVDSN